jgi:hypothetical protein
MNDLEKLLLEYEVEIAKVRGTYHITLVGGPKPSGLEHYVHHYKGASLDVALALAYQSEKESDGDTND